jgi:predicted ATPase/transcriptional regulator with XRE-family HTH domain
VRRGTAVAKHHDQTGRQSMLNAEAQADFSQMLRDRRLAAGLTQEALAERAGLGVRSIQALERGESKPLRGTLLRLAGALDLTQEERGPFSVAAEPAPRRRAPAPSQAGGQTANTQPGQPAVSAHRHGYLPVPLTSFVGREQEMADIARLLSTARLLTMTGPGGTGKTRLTVQAAAAARPHHADGVVFVSLAAIGDSALVAVAIAAALGVRQGEDPSLTHALIAGLRAKRLLLVLDNFEHVAPAAPLVNELLAACAGLQIVVTSRMPLHVSGEQEYAVPPLPVPAAGDAEARDPVRLHRSAAVTLFVQRVQLVRPEFRLDDENAPVVAEICRRLDGLPLAIELAASRVKHMPPAALVSRLDQRLRILKGGPQDLPERQQTLRGAIAWSYDLLEPSEQTLFRRLAVFNGGWTLEAAEDVCAAEDLACEVLDLLDSLVDKSLILAEADACGDIRYGMLDSIRAFAAECMIESGEVETVQCRHAHYYRHLAREATPEPGQWMNTTWIAWTEREQDNLRAALRWARRRGEAEQEMRLMLPLVGLRYAHRQLREAQDELQNLLELQERHRGTVPPELRMQALAALAGCLLKDGEYSRSEALIEECLAHCRAQQLTAYVKIGLQVLGMICCATANLEQAAAVFEESRALAQASGSRVSELQALLGLGDVARGWGDGPTLAALSNEALILSRALGERDLEGFALHNMAIAAWLEQDLARAETLLAEGLTVFRQLDTRKLAIAELLTTLGRVKHALGDMEQARCRLKESLTIAQEFGPFFVVPDDMDELALVAATSGQHETAARLFGATRALRAARRMAPSPVYQPRMENAIAVARATMGDAAFDAALAAGQAMRGEDAIALALSTTGDVSISAAAGVPA